MATFGKIGARGMLETRKFARDYIQDGLVAMWDGIENAGWNQHDANATVWKDLIGNRDFTLNGAVVGTDSMSWNGNYRSSCLSQPPLFWQMEIVFRTMSNRNWKIWFGDYGHSISSYFGAVIESKTARTDNSSYKFYSTCVSIPLVNPGDSTKWAIEMYENGVLKNISKGNFNYVATDWSSGSMQLGGANGLSLRSIRLYSRHLASNEVLSNLSTDKARFNLT